MSDRLVLCLAQGFYIGRIPLMPGTFGSLLGIGWVALLLIPRSLAFYIAGSILAALVSVCVCGQAERILGQTDPGSVVLDEIVAMPVCFASWIGSYARVHRQWPGPEFLVAD